MSEHGESCREHEVDKSNGGSSRAGRHTGGATDHQHFEGRHDYGALVAAVGRESIPQRFSQSVKGMGWIQKKAKLLEMQSLQAEINGWTRGPQHLKASAQVS